MTIVTNTASRKELAKAIGKELGIEAKYMGVPSCNYQIGQYILDKEGVLHGPDFEPLRSFLQRNGMMPEDDISLSGEPTVQEEEPAQENIADFVSVTVPADGITPLQLKNLIFMLYSKQYLIGKMTGGDLLNIPDFLEARLIEKTPETIADFLSLLDTAKEKGMTGFDFKDEKVTLTFRAYPDEPGRNMVYAMFTARILKAAREATRIFPEKQEPENEKYFARAWLLRLGYGGAAYKDERNLLLKHLKGHSAFPTNEAAEKHKEKYAGIRKEKKADGQEVESHE